MNLQKEMNNIEELKQDAQKAFAAVTVFSVDYGDFERFIQKAYGVSEYSIVADQEMGNDSTKTFNVKPGKLDKWETSDIEKFVAGENHTFVTSTLLKDLCNKDIIQAGTYSIDICW